MAQRIAGVASSLCTLRGSELLEILSTLLLGPLGEASFLENTWGQFLEAKLSRGRSREPGLSIAAGRRPRPTRRAPPKHIQQLRCRDSTGIRRRSPISQRSPRRTKRPRHLSKCIAQRGRRRGQSWSWNRNRSLCGSTRGSRLHRTTTARRSHRQLSSRDFESPWVGALARAASALEAEWGGGAAETASEASKASAPSEALAPWEPLSAWVPLEASSAVAVQHHMLLQDQSRRCPRRSCCPCLCRVNTGHKRCPCRCRWISHRRLCPSSSSKSPAGIHLGQLGKGFSLGNPLTPLPDRLP
mmetsp:Transcript_18016/g.27194  ORF Transcript_18016/g.27194 Transcript_18016/m.27194 type:complete len:300 (+) Transcript_18016:482-1381(+)